MMNEGHIQTQALLFRLYTANTLQCSQVGKIYHNGSVVESPTFLWTN